MILTYVDDTTWVASSRVELQQILNKTKLFYEINDSQINVKKFKLLMINGGKQEKIEGVRAGLKGEKVCPKLEMDVIRYLGIYYTVKHQDKVIFNIIKRKIKTVVEILKWKRI